MDQYSQHSVSRAIRRSRAFRARIERRRRRSITLATTLSLSVALGGAFSLASFAGVDLADAAVSRAESLIDLMDQRSPGARTEGELTKTKHKKEAVADRELPKSLADVLAPPAPGLVPVDIEVPAPVIEVASTTPPGEILSPPTVVTPPHGGDTPPPGPPNTPPLPPPPALPEPGTWMTMILGFGLVGWFMRRSKAADQARITA